MKITEPGLVLKEVKLRESDKILTLLTPHHGIVSASARGSMRPNNKLFSASGLFCYSEWTLHEGKAMYSVDEATPIEVFFGLRQSIEAVALASYIAEMLQILSPTGQEAARLLKLALNCLYLLSEQKKEPALVKAVFELRSLAESGYMPDLECCGNCGAEEDLAYFALGDGMLLCAGCAAKQGLTSNVLAGVLSSMRHIVASEDEKLFAFTVGGETAGQLQRLVERYLLFHLDYPPKTLDFLKTVL